MWTEAGVGSVSLLELDGDAMQAGLFERRSVLRRKPDHGSTRAVPVEFYRLVCAAPKRGDRPFTIQLVKVDTLRSCQIDEVLSHRIESILPAYSKRQYQREAAIIRSRRRSEGKPSINGSYDLLLSELA